MTPEHLVQLVAQWSAVGFACVVIVAFAAWLAFQIVLMVWES
jgi:hypothetical protein